MTDNTAKSGVIFALLAYGLWGFMPVYFKQIEQVAPTEILVHRIIWAFVFTLLLIFVLRRMQNVRTAMKNRKHLLILCASSLLVATNWLIYIWAVNNGRILEASLGYYINPIVNVVLALAFLGERLRAVQWLAVGLAAGGVGLELYTFGDVPWVALGLAFSFGTYGLLRKKVPIDSQSGLLLETSILLLPAMLYLIFFIKSDTSNLFENDLTLNFWLLMAGPVTSIPLILFAAAAQRLNYSTLGFFQYIAPSILFLLAIGVYGEPLSYQKSITFIFIWSALLVFSLDAIRWQRKIRNSY